MIKAKALCAVQDIHEPEVIHRGPAMQMQNHQQLQVQQPQVIPAPGIENLIGKQQNFVIESYGGQDDVRACVTRLAVLLVKQDALLKGFIRKLRQQYTDRQKGFSFSLSAWSKEEKRMIREIFVEELCGIVDSVNDDRYGDILSGNLVFTTAARLFLDGQYMEIGVYELIKEAMEELAATYQVSYRLYRNVKVTTKTGYPKNEFDIVIECQGKFYVVEVKSGVQFNGWGNLLEVGKEYDIVPHRLLLVDSYLTAEKAGRIEAFCEYNVSNLEDDMVHRKVIEMVGRDLKKGV